MHVQTDPRRESVSEQSVPAARLMLFMVACVFAGLVHVVYVDVFAASGNYDYMGVRVLPASAVTQLLFLGLAVLPSLWLPVHMRRPSDVVQLFLYYAVHVTSCMLLPLVSMSPLLDQLLFALAITAGLAEIGRAHV